MREVSLWDAILSLKTPEELLHFFNDLCTPKEISIFSERWKVCKLLQPGTLSYREISKATGASLTTVVRVARCLHNNGGYKAALTQILEAL